MITKPTLDEIRNQYLDYKTVPVSTALEAEIMAVKHKTKDIYGLQFHPESIMTPDGITMIQNFLEA